MYDKPVSNRANYVMSINNQKKSVRIAFDGC